MEFRFTDEQIMIRDSAAAFVDEVASSEAVRTAMQSEYGFDQAVWQRMTEELYWQALPIDEELGGLGLGMVELVAILEQTGRRLLCSPFFSTVTLACYALQLAGPNELANAAQERILAGEMASLVHTGPHGGHRVEDIGITLENGCLNGTASHVLNGDSAQLFVVAAREGERVSLLLVDADTQGLTRSAQPTMDQTRRLAKLEFNDVAIDDSQRLCQAGEGVEVLTVVLELAAIASAAEAVGGAQQALDDTVAYIQERVQFGRSIASFQAVKHKCADMMLKVEAARSALYYAACIVDEFLAGQCSLTTLQEAASTAKTYAGEGFFFVAGCGIQLHGGVGITSEYDIQLYFKRARSLEAYLGSPSWHRERVASLLLDDVGGAA